MRKGGSIITILAGSITGTVTASRSMRRVLALFWQLRMTFRNTGLKMPRPRRSGIQNFRLAKIRKKSVNFVLLDHQNGEYSLFVHMKPGSVIVKPGDRVPQGQLVGRIGFAGDSIFPHLHYSLMDGLEVFKAWGLPAYFSQFHRVLGASSIRVKQAPVDSGDFLESEAVYSDAK